MRLESYAEGKWFAGSGEGQPIIHAVTGDVFGQVSSTGLDFGAMLRYARTVGGPKLRAMTIHQRAVMLKAVAKMLMERKEEFYDLSKATGATRTDSWIDIEGGISTFFVFSSKARRELPDECFHIDGPAEALSKTGSFVGRHICVPLEGAALHINAFNFPCWGMLEKLAPTFLAGVPAIVKPASSTAYLAQHMVRRIVESGLLPEGALQIICGGVGDLFEHLTSQDVVTFTGSAATGKRLKSHRVIVDHAIRFNMEADSLNCSILGPDASPDSEEFSLFIKEVAREMTVKAGQKCTAIRRAIVPEAQVDAVVDALRARLSQVAVGDPSLEGVRMGPLASLGQVEEVRSRVNQLVEASELVLGNFEQFEVKGADPERGAFFPPTLLLCRKPLQRTEVHDIEAFGPVSTVMPYSGIDQAIQLAKLGQGSLVGSLFTADNSVAREIALGVAAQHGRLLIVNSECAKESTGHGSPLPHLVHGGPGRAGGGEEMGGVRSVLHYMQRTALQGSPSTLTAICNRYTRGAKRIQKDVHPFRQYFEDLEVGEAVISAARRITLEDIERFAELSGDRFYAHMDEAAAKANPFFEGRVAHGYFLVSLAAGLFVDPAPGPVLANYGLEDLRFMTPVYAGDEVRVALTCMKKTPKYDQDYGVIEWDAELTNQKDEIVALYTVLTLVAKRPSN